MPVRTGLILVCCLGAVVAVGCTRSKGSGSPTTTTTTVASPPGLSRANRRAGVSTLGPVMSII